MGITSILEKDEPLARTPRARGTEDLNSLTFEIFGLLIGGDLQTVEIFRNAYLHRDLVQCGNADAGARLI